MNILISGGLGFIGSNFLELIIKNKRFDKIYILDNNSISIKKYYIPIELNKNIQLINHNLLKFKEFKVDLDCIVHLAAAGNVIESVNNPIYNFENNVRATLNILEFAKKSKVSKFIFSSTGGALMGNTSLPINENSIPKPISPYGASKLCCESYIKAYSSMYQIESYILRFGNVYGPYCFHKKGVINKLFDSILNKKNFNVFGDGTSSRDYIHVKDVSKAILSCLLKDSNSLQNTYHLSTNVETTLNELISIFSKIANKKIQVQYFPARIGEVYRNFADYNLAKNELSFEPNKDLESLLEDTFRWYKNYLANE